MHILTFFFHDSVIKTLGNTFFKLLVLWSRLPLTLELFEHYTEYYAPYCIIVCNARGYIIDSIDCVQCNVLYFGILSINKKLIYYFSIIWLFSQYLNIKD